MERVKIKFNIFDKMPHYLLGRGSSDQRRVEIEVYESYPIAIEWNARPREYPSVFTWKELIATKNMLPTDEIHNIDYKEEKENMFGSMDDREPRTFYVPMITVKRKRLENDKEYSNRMANQARRAEQKIEEDKKKEAEEYDMYIRLRAKFEKKAI